MLLGEIGLLLGIVEAGLHVQLPALRQVGLRGAGVALLGSAVFPVPVAFGVGRAFGLRGTEAMAVAVCMVPSATAVALLVLRRAKALNTPTGQLVVAATALDDTIALVCISELRALKAGTAAEFVKPVFAAIGFVTGVGLLAVYIMPRILLRLLKLAPARLVEKTALCALAAVTCGLCSALEYGGSSYLLGAFLSGVCFCTLPSITHVWERQVKRVQTWLLRIFFGCTIGFEVPVASFRKPRVVAFAAFLLVPIASKMLTAVLAKPRTPARMLTVAFSMTTLGELAFVAAAVGHHELHLTSADTFASVCLAILVSNCVGPALLRRTLRLYTEASLRDIAAAKAEMAAALLTPAHSNGHGEAAGANGDASGVAAPAGAVIYYRLNVRCVARWGLMADLLRVLAVHDVAVVDFRSDASGDHALYDAFLRDSRLRDAKPGEAATPGLAERLAELRAALGALLPRDTEGDVGDEGEELVASGETVDFRSLRGVLLRRWLPRAKPVAEDGGAESDEEAHATRQMREEAGRLGHRPALQSIFGPVKAASSAASSPHAPPSPPPLGAATSIESVTGGGSPPAPLQRSGPSQRFSALGPAADASEPLAVPLGSVALARAAEADALFAAATAEAELEKARENEEEDPRGLLGFLREERGTLEPRDLAGATSAAEHAFVAASAQAEAAEAEALQAVEAAQAAAQARRLARTVSGGIDAALAGADVEEGSAGGGMNPLSRFFNRPSLDGPRPPVGAVPADDAT